MSDAVSGFITKEALTNGVSNAFFNGLAAWYLLKSKPWMPVLGEAGIVVDVIATSIILLFIVTLIIIPLSRSKKRKGKAPEFSWDSSRQLHRFFMRLPPGLVARAFCFAGLGIVVVSPVSLLPYFMFGIEGMSGADYAIVKGVWAGFMAGVMCVPMIQLGLADSGTQHLGEQQHAG